MRRIAHHGPSFLPENHPEPMDLQFSSLFREIPYTIWTYLNHSEPNSVIFHILSLSVTNQTSSIIQTYSKIFKMFASFFRQKYKCVDGFCPFSLNLRFVKHQVDNKNSRQCYPVLIIKYAIYLHPVISIMFIYFLLISHGWRSLEKPSPIPTMSHTFPRHPTWHPLPRQGTDPLPHCKLCQLRCPANPRCCAPLPENALPPLEAIQI